MHIHACKAPHIDFLDEPLPEHGPVDIYSDDVGSKLLQDKERPLAVQRSRAEYSWHWLACVILYHREPHSETERSIFNFVIANITSSGGGGALI